MKKPKIVMVGIGQAGIATLNIMNNKDKEDKEEE